jgi:hypothetical protein
MSDRSAELLGDLRSAGARLSGACQCKAFTDSRTGICYHRAAARLVRRALEMAAPVTLQGYTVSGEPQYLCPAYASKTPNKTKWSDELINGHCDGCGAGPSVARWQVAVAA